MLLNQSRSLSCLHSWACPIAKDWLLWFSVNVQRQRLKKKWNGNLKAAEHQNSLHVLLCDAPRRPLTQPFLCGLCMNVTCWYRSTLTMNYGVASCTSVCLSAQAATVWLAITEFGHKWATLSETIVNPKFVQSGWCHCVLTCMVTLAWNHSTYTVLWNYAGLTHEDGGNWQLVKLEFCWFIVVQYVYVFCRARRRPLIYCLFVIFLSHFCVKECNSDGLRCKRT